jgi:hypothetical protein
MVDESLNDSKCCQSSTCIVSMSVALIAAIGGLIYTSGNNHRFAAQSAGTADVTGKLTVSYNIITSKTANTEESMGSTIEATRVQYFPSYVLVTTTSGVTYLWAIERIKKLEVSHVPAPTSQQQH